jgi:hypothetical protein
MKMNIEYPTLVEQGFAMMKKAGLNVTKEQVYKRMIDTGMIDKTGQPTQAAIDNGLIDECEQTSSGDYEPTTVAGMKRMYPMYEQFADSHFKRTELGWIADAYVIRAVANQQLNDPDSTEEQRQMAYGMLAQLNESGGNE